MEQNLKKIIVTNTVSSYVLLVFRVVTAIFLTRFLFQGLGETYYGFWVLLWAVFGYSLFLDFGFGTSMQKYTAEVTVSKDYDVFNSILSTVFFSYTLMGVLIAILTVGASFFLQDIFHFNGDAELSLFRKVFWIFGLGSALTFPTGVFSEVLAGLKKIHRKNLIMIINLFINLVGVYLIFEWKGGILEITIFSLVLNLLTNLFMWISVKRFLPKVKILLNLVQYSKLREVTSFSFYAYIIMCGNIVIYKTDQILLGVIVGMEAVAIYQISTRIPVMLENFSTQFQDNLSPIAASLHKAGDQTRLGSILLNSNRFIAFLACMLFTITTPLISPIMYLWLGVDNPEVIHIAYVMSASMFLLILFRSGSSKVLLMAGKERFLARVAMMETTMNLIFSIVLIHLLGVVGVAYGTLIPNVLFSLFFIFPLACKYGKTNMLYYFKKVYMPLATISIPLGLCLYLVANMIPLESWTIIKLFIYPSVTAGVYCLFGYLYILTDENRSYLKNLNIF